MSESTKATPLEKDETASTKTTSPERDVTERKKTTSHEKVETATPTVRREDVVYKLRDINNKMVDSWKEIFGANEKFEVRL